MIRSIYLRLKHEDTDPAILAYQAVIISNDLYATDTVSVLDITKGYTKPVDCKVRPIFVPPDLIKAHESLLNK